MNKSFTKTRRSRLGNDRRLKETEKMVGKIDHRTL